MTNTTPNVTLRAISAETVMSIVKLAVAEHQTCFVAPNAVSLAQAAVAPEAWYRAIHCDEEPVGFVMLSDDSLRTPVPADPKIGVWRFMIDQRHQRRGIGREAMRQVIEHVRAKGRFTRLELSYVPGPGCPEPFYLSLGFRHTGRLDEDEIVLELPLEVAAHGPRSATVANLHPKTIARGLPDLWSPRVIAEVDDAYVKVARVQGTFDWHSHDNEDELFYVLNGRLTIRMEDRDVTLSEGELFVVPKGVRHCPVADGECHLLLVERKATKHTGNEVTARTRSIEEQLRGPG